MRIAYISETKESCDIIKRIILKIKYIFNIIDIDKSKEQIMYLIPIYLNKNTKKIKVKRFLKKIIKDLKKQEIGGVILSKQLKNSNNIKEYFIEKNLKVFNGRYLFKVLTYEAIEYILNKQNKKMEESEITILINDFNNLNIEIITEIAKTVKILNIVTKNINNAKRIEKQLYNELGIIVNISNNKRKGLLKSKIIVNFDFAEKEINQYNINNRAIIVNLDKKIVIKSKRFDGININYFKIDIPKRYKIDGFDNEEIYEGITYKKNFCFVKKKIISDKIKIIRLIGNNINIRNNEYIERK